MTTLGCIFTSFCASVAIAIWLCFRESSAEYELMLLEDLRAMNAKDAEIARLRAELAGATAATGEPDSNAVYDAVRCRVCGRPWQEHDAGCYLRRDPEGSEG